MYSLRMSFWIVPPSSARAVPVSFRGEDVHPPDDVRRGVDRHARRDLREGDPPQEAPHVVERRHVDAALAHLAERLGVVRVDPVEGRVVEGDGEPALAVGEEEAEPGVGVLGGPEPREHPHRPEAAPVHRRVDPPGVGELTGVADPVLRGAGGRSVQPVDGDLPEGDELGLALRRPREDPPEDLLLPAPTRLVHRPPSGRFRRRRGRRGGRPARSHRGSMARPP